MSGLLRKRECRVTAAMLRAVAEPRREHERALQIQPRVVFVGETDRAVDLYRLARDADRGVGAARFQAAHDRRARSRFGIVVERAQRVLERRLSELLLNPQIDRTVLERLEAPDRLAELHARLHV